MKPISPELSSLLASRQFYAVDLYTLWGGNLGLTGSVTRVGSVAAGNATISSMSSVVGLVIGMPVVGLGIVPGSIITAVGGSSITLNVPAFITNNPVILNIGNTTLRYTSGDMDVMANGYKFSAGGEIGPYFDRKDNKAKIHLKIGTEVDTFVVDIIPGSSQVFGVPFAAAVRYGIFDGAYLMMERCFMPTYGDTTYGTIRQFVGRVSQIDIGKSICTLSANSHLELLNIQMPKNLYTATCINNLGDKACGINLNAYVSNGTITSGSTQGVLNATVAGGPFTTGQFLQGKIVFTSGVLNGLSATITNYVSGSPSVISLVYFLPTTPGIGDTFWIYYGCDKTTGNNGCAKFSNISRYRGFPYIPQPTTAA